MGAPRNREELKAYILRKLGSPVIEINLADVQIDDAIVDALSFWQEYHYDAIQKYYIAHELTQEEIDQRYIVMGEDVLSVPRILKPHSAAAFSADELFSIEYQIRLNEMWDLVRTDLTGYVIARQHIAMIDELLNTNPLVRYKRHENKLYLDFDWNKFVPGQFLIIDCYKILNPDDFPKLYGDRVLRALAVEYARLQWGYNLIKFGDIKLPGGVVLNGGQIVGIADKQIAKLEEEFISRWQEPDVPMIG